jgi:phospholipase C
VANPRSDLSRPILLFVITLLSLSSLPAKAQTLSETTLFFGDWVVQTTSTAEAVTLTNTLAVPLTISSISASGAFAETSECPIDPDTLAAGKSCKISVTFSPTVLGVSTGTLSVNDNSSTSPQTMGLSGTGVKAATLSAATLAFGNVVLNTTSAPQSVTLENNQRVPLTISAISASGDFAQSSNCPLSPSTLGAKLSCQISVTFTPATLGDLTGSLTVSDDAANAPQTAALHGAGKAPVSLSTASLAFAGQVLSTTSAAKSVTLTNNQTVPLTISAISASTNFAQTSTCPLSPSTLDAGNSCSISVTFTPTTVGALTGTLTITDDASTSPQTAKLSGTGTLTGLSAITVTPANSSVAPGSQQQMTATGSLPKGLLLNISNYVSWTSSSTSVATVNATGLAQATSTPGTTTITATYGTISGTTALTVTGTASTPIQHIVIIFQENRSTDNLFHDPALIARGADLASSGINSKGQTIPLAPVDLGTVGSNPDNFDLMHVHRSWLAMCDMKSTGVCAMDGADLIAANCTAGSANCPPPNPQFMYVKQADVQPYFDLAEQYTFGDRMFQTNQSSSFPAHQYIISATSMASTDINVPSNFYDAESPNTVVWPKGGCVAPPDESVSLIDITNMDAATNETTSAYPCYDHPTVTDLLEKANVSWRYYAPSTGSIWNGPTAIEHMCGPNVAPPNATKCSGADYTSHVVLSSPQVLTDIANNNLASVSWVIPTNAYSDHPKGNAGEGPSWVSSIVNAIGNSPYWSSTAIFITWDDWGGWYDHVPPQILNSYEYGFRVPLVVVSPYAKQAYISHVTHDFGSIVKFIETTYNLPSLGYADAVADDFSDCFDFTQTPAKFKTINAPLKADYFINDKRPPEDPDDY